MSLVDQQNKTPDLPQYCYCKRCGRVLVWYEWGYVHLDGWANCRDPNAPAKLSDACYELDLEHPIEPQPQSIQQAKSLHLREPSKSLFSKRQAGE